jgi:hypothetical protein
MNYNVIFKAGESCKWRCMVSQECLASDTAITSAKWYDATVFDTHGSAMTLYIVNEHGEAQAVPHYQHGEWEGASQIGILNPELAEERLRADVQKKISAQKASHQTAMNNLRHEMRSINVKGFVDVCPEEQ